MSRGSHDRDAADGSIEVLGLHRLPKQLGFHEAPAHAMVERRAAIRSNAVVTVAKLPQDRIGTRVPTGPAERRISVHVPGLHRGAHIKEKLDCDLAANSRCAMEGRFTL